MNMSCEVITVSDLRVKQRRIIKLLHFESVSPNEIHKRLQNLYGESTISVQHFRNWCYYFSSGRSDIKDQLRSGRQTSVHNEETKKKIEELNAENGQATFRKLSAILEISYSMVHEIIHDDLK